MQRRVRTASTLRVSSYHGGPEAQGRALRSMRGRVDGVLVLSPYAEQPGFLTDNLPQSLPTVLINARLPNADHPVLSIDDHAGAMTMVEHLLRAGHRRIAFIGGPTLNVDAAPAAQTQVTATNLATSLARTVQASNGGCSVGGLPPGSCRIDVTANGQHSSQNVTVQVGQTATYEHGSINGQEERRASLQFKPDGTLGYKGLSIAANKEWDTDGGVKFNVRADILNVFNWVNDATFNGDTGTAQDVNTAYATPTGVLVSPMRTFRLAFGLNW